MPRPAWHEVLLLMGLAAFATYILQYDLVSAQSPKPAVYAEFRSKLALDGHDPVAYFKTGKPAKGLAQHAASWNGATWHFASADNKAAFEASPQTYAPQYGGYCAWAVRMATPPRGSQRTGASSTASSTSTTTARCSGTGRRTFPATSPRAMPTGPRC